jgi:GntR family transcriptional regulator
LSRSAKKSTARGRRPYRYAHTDEAKAFDSLVKNIKLDRDQESPLWLQLKNELEDSIDSGQLPPNTRLPPEQVLCDYLDVSRPVVRAAISSLANDGKVLKFPRKGMYVAAPDEYVDYMHTNLGAFSDLTEKGYSVAVKTHQLYIAKANAKECEVFGQDDEFDVIRILRVYKKDNQPITLANISLPAHRVPGLENLKLDNRSLLRVIKDNFGLNVVDADRWLSAVCPQPEEAELLQVGAETPLIFIRSLGRDASGAPLEYYEALHNPQIAEIHLTAYGKR